MSFIQNVMLDVGLHMEITEVIMSYVTSVATNVKWNGQRVTYFNPQRRIRRGDPISPYLFILCMDKSSHLCMQGGLDLNFLSYVRRRHATVR
jgi:hypothetical protein